LLEWNRVFLGLERLRLELIQSGGCTDDELIEKRRLDGPARARELPAVGAEHFQLVRLGSRYSMSAFT